MPLYEDPEQERKYQSLLAAYRLQKQQQARDDMMHFAQLMRPDPNEPDNARKSQCEATPLARLLCQVIERVDKGLEKRVCVSVGPQFGKSDRLSRDGPAWLSGRNPYRHLILGSYNDTFAQEFGGDVRELMKSKAFHQVFPEHGLRPGSEAKDFLVTNKGGKLSFVGVGGSGSGKPADVFFVDDPFKNDEDAQSATYREKVWKWFNGVAMARCHNDTAIIVVHTRWHEDDLIGRLCDPDHPERNKEYKGIAERWNYYNLPAIVEEPSLAEALGLTLEIPHDPFVREQFGTKPMASLWEARKSLVFLAEAKMMDERVFGALYMGKPSPDTGTYFTVDDIVEYHDPSEMPSNLRWYGASDHAVSQEQRADSSVLGCAGVDEDDDIWVPPDIFWGKLETDDMVDELIHQMKTKKPQWWCLESELISKSFGPFLKKRMHEEKVYTTLIHKTPSKKKRVRARAIQGRMQMRKVHFPAFAPWWPEAKAQLLKFDYGTHDDFVDWLSWIGLGLTSEYAPSEHKPRNVPRTGTLAWIKAASTKEQRAERIREAAKGW